MASPTLQPPAPLPSDQLAENVAILVDDLADSLGILEVIQNRLDITQRAFSVILQEFRDRAEELEDTGGP